MKVVFGHSGPVTVAVLVPEEGSIAARVMDGDTAVGVTVCSPKDVQVDAIGERIAMGRAMEEMGRYIAEKAEASVVTRLDALKAWAEDQDSVYIHADLTPAEFISLAEKLDEIKSPVCFTGSVA